MNGKKNQILKLKFLICEIKMKKFLIYIKMLWKR